MLTIAALVTRSRLAAAASAGARALSTLGAYLLAVWIGPVSASREIRTRAGLAAGLIEVAGLRHAGAWPRVTADSGAPPAAVPGRSPRRLAAHLSARSLARFAGTAVGRRLPARLLTPVPLPALAPAVAGARARAQSAVSMVVAAVSGRLGWPPWPCSASR